MVFVVISLVCVQNMKTWGVSVRACWRLSLLASSLWRERRSDTVWGHTLITCPHTGSNDSQMFCLHIYYLSSANYGNKQEIAWSPERRLHAFGEVSNNVTRRRLDLTGTTTCESHSSGFPNDFYQNNNCVSIRYQTIITSEAEFQHIIMTSFKEYHHIESWWWIWDDPPDFQVIL